MAENLRDCEALLGVKGKHALKEILEFFGVDIFAIFGFSMGLPKKICSLSSNQLVVRIIGASCVERRSLSKHNEADDSRCNDINSTSRIRFAHVNFRRHIALCSQLCN